VPTGDPPHRIAASDVPYGLAESTQSSAAPTTAAPAADDPRVFFLDGEDLLVPRARDVGEGSQEERLDELLGALAAGPTEEELAEQLSTALRPDVDLSIQAFDDGVVTVDVDGAQGAQSAGESRRAVAQIVLTATSLPGVDAVLFSADGQRIEAPLPSGELSPAPLTAEDYVALAATTAPEK
jgi:spore germination protein GerM